MNCPTPEHLHRFAAHETTIDEASQIEGHSSGCADCRERLEEIRADLGLISELRAALLVEPTSADATGTSGLANYRILGRLGSGGMGIVYEAEQLSPRRRVALKILSPTSLSPRSLRRFELEGEVLARLDHPSIARIHEAGTFGCGEASRPFIAMELVDGVDLRDWLQESRPLSQRLDLFLALTQAVEHAHLRGVLHRDLKPQNVLVTPEDHPKVLDFGIARALDSRDPGTLETLDGQLLGTLSHMSPEQLSGDTRAIDTRCDVYALGVILYELVCGALPIELSGLGVAKAVSKLANSDPRPPSAHGRVHRDLELVILKSIARDPTTRYQSVAELAADLRRYRADAPVTARAPSTMYLGWKFARRHRVGVVLGAIAIALALLGSILVQREAALAREQARVAKAVSDLLVDVLAESDPRHGLKGLDYRVRDALDDAVERLDEGEALDKAVEAELRATIGRAYLGLGVYDRAEGELERAIDLLAVERSAFSWIELAETRIDRRNANGAARAAEMARSVVADHGPSELAVHAHRVSAAAALLHYDFELAERELRSARKALEFERQADPGVSAALFALEADLELAQGFPKRASAPAGAAAELFSTELGPRHPSTLEARIRLAMLLSGGERALEANVLYATVLTDSQSLLGAEHPLVGRTMIGLAALAEIRGDHKAALAFAQRAHDFFERLFEDHPLKLAAERRLGRLSADRDGDTGLDLLERSLAGSRSRYGNDHPETATAAYLLAGELIRRDRLDEARPLVRESCATLESRLGPDHPITAFARFTEGHLAYSEGDPVAAIALLEPVIERLRSVYGERSLFLAGALRLYATALVADGRIAEAEDSFESLIQTAAGSPIAEEPSFDEARRRLADLRVKRGDAQGARAVYEREFPVTDDLRRLKFENNLASISYRTKNYEDAAREFGAILDEKVKRFGPDEATIATARNNLGRALLAVDRPGEAADQFREAQRIWTLPRGPEHFGPAWARVNLAEALLETGEIEAALTESAEALRIAQSVLRAGNERLVRFLRVRAACLAMAGEIDTARPLLESALKISGPEANEDGDAARRELARLDAR